MADFPEMTQGRVWNKPHKGNIPAVSNGGGGGELTVRGRVKGNIS